MLAYFAGRDEREIVSMRVSVIQCPPTSERSLSNLSTKTLSLQIAASFHRGPTAPPTSAFGLGRFHHVDWCRSVSNALIISWPNDVIATDRARSSWLNLHHVRRHYSAY